MRRDFEHKINGVFRENTIENVTLEFFGENKLFLTYIIIHIHCPYSSISTLSGTGLLLDQTNSPRELGPNGVYLLNIPYFVVGDKGIRYFIQISE